MRQIGEPAAHIRAVRKLACFCPAHQILQGCGVFGRIIRPTGEIRTVFCQADTTYSETDKPLFISIAMMDIQRSMSSPNRVTRHARSS